jgi:hypothetical protein
MILRVAKEDSAFLYQLLEANEGMTNYSTLTTDKGLGYRDIALHVAPDLKEELEEFLRSIMKDLKVQVLPSP